MTKKEYLDFHRACCDKMIEVTIAKNNDYAGFSEDDPFANFSVVEAVKIASVEQGFLTRMMDKISRVNTFVRKGVLSVKDETVEDSLIDLANYAILMAGYIKSRRQAGVEVSHMQSKCQFYDFGNIFGDTVNELKT